MTIRITDLPANLVCEQDSLTNRRMLFLSIVTKTSPNAREHPMARVRRVKKERAATRRAFIGQTVPTLPVRVTFTRMSTQVCDDDNLPTASKSLRDEIAAMYGVGDSPRDPIVWKYEQGKSKRNQQGMRITVEAISVPDGTEGKHE